MRICLIGKFPPIQGGVSTRTYWTAHGLAALGHEVHVVTNAKEAAPPFRMFMRPEDWARCEAVYGAGSVTVHWSDPVDRSQSYTPMASPFVSKLATIAARLHERSPFDIVLSYYMEPYGVAGHLAAEMIRVPHATRMAGSDAGRLWRHPQFETLYDHVLRSAAVLIAARGVAERAIERGVSPGRIAFDGGFLVPEDLFTPDGPVLDLSSLRAEIATRPEWDGVLWGDFRGDRPFLGVCGKLGERKGSFALLAAMRRLREQGMDLGLVVLGHGEPGAQRRFRAQAQALGLAECILQIPFLPHWRVPEFLRACLAVCCLEQGFPITFHNPIIPREVLLCGTCLVGSAEIIRKMPQHADLPSGYGCVAVADVNDVEALTANLVAIAKQPDLIPVVGRRGRSFASHLQSSVVFPHPLESILQAAAGQGATPPLASLRRPAEQEAPRFPLAQLAAAALQDRGEGPEFRLADEIADLTQARAVLAVIQSRISAGEESLSAVALAIQTEIEIAAAEDEVAAEDLGPAQDPLFRFRGGRWAIGEEDWEHLVPLRDPGLRLLTFSYDISGFRTVRSLAELAAPPSSTASYVLVFGKGIRGARRQPLLVDGMTARLLQLSDGTRTVGEIIASLRSDRPGGREEGYFSAWVEHIFVHGLVSLQDQRMARGGDFARPDRPAERARPGAVWAGQPV